MAAPLPWLAVYPRYFGPSVPACRVARNCFRERLGGTLPGRVSSANAVKGGEQDTEGGQAVETEAAPASPLADGYQPLGVPGGRPGVHLRGPPGRLQCSVSSLSSKRKNFARTSRDRSILAFTELSFTRRAVPLTSLDWATITSMPSSSPPRAVSISIRL